MDTLERRLARLVARVRLAREHELQLPVAGEQSIETLLLAEQQHCTLVGREATREHDRERIGIECAQCPCRVAAAPRDLRSKREPYIVHQAFALARARGP